jgi:uncharacterized protein (DUF486 family)
MLNAILSTLSIMGWLGIILAILVVVNTTCGTIFNVFSKGEKFSWKRLLGGMGKAAVFYIAAALVSIACTMLPYINNMISDSFGVVLLTDDLLKTLSSVGVLGIVVSVITIQAKNAIKNTVQLANMGNLPEEVTWNVEEE